MKYSSDTNAISKLDEVMKLCYTITTSFVRYHSTCLNECFHSVKAKLVPKNFNLGNTVDVRCYAAVLQFNMGNQWLNLVYDKLGLDKSNLELFEELFPKAHSLFKEILHDDNYYSKKLKEEEEEQKNYEQYLKDKQNNIPMHS